jgi:hypothetical protein
MHISSEQLDAFRIEVQEELEMLDFASPKGAVKAYSEAILGNSDPWIVGTAATGPQQAQEKGAPPDFVVDAHRLVHLPTVKERMCAALSWGLSSNGTENWDRA